MKKLLLLGAIALSLLAPGALRARPADCLPVRAVFYESSDWQRLAQGLAADPSACASYYITIPALAADKTQMVANRASVVRSLGSNFHAAAEINYSAWQSWVNSTGNTWYAAGVLARQRMTAAGFNVAAGDTWAVNEFSSAVRAGTGSARQNVRDLVRGLFNGDGTEPQTQGIVFVVGVGQNGLSFPQYKANLESWFQDQNFWADMTSYVSDFFQETYGDVRNYAIAGADMQTRASLLNAFLQHPLDLAVAPGAPPAALGARNFLTAAYGPLANASWAWGSAYGWTQVGSDVMADYISAQTYAMRLTGEARIGFAWNPLNTQNLSPTDFSNQVAGILARLAGSIHETDGGNPSQACVTTGCSSVVDGATPATGWNGLSTWTPTAAAFTSAPFSAPTGIASSAITLQLQTGGVNTTLPNPTTVTIASSSSTATFATASTGPWSPRLVLTLPPGTGTTTFYALDSAAGTPMISATTGSQTQTQAETIVAPAAPPAPPPSVAVVSATFTPQQGHLHVALQLADQTGKPVEARVSFAVLRNSSTFLTTAGQTASDGMIAVTGFPPIQLGCYKAEVRSVVATGYVWNTASPTQTFCVQTLPARVAAVAYGRKNRHLHVGVHVVDDSGHPVAAAHVSFVVLRGTVKYASGAGTTRSDGWFALTSGKKLAKGCYHTRVTAITAHDYTWDHVTGSNSYCVSTLTTPSSTRTGKVRTGR